MALVDEVNPPAIVVPATVSPGLAGKVSVQEALLVIRFGGDQKSCDAMAMFAQLV